MSKLVVLNILYQSSLRFPSQRQQRPHPHQSPDSILDVLTSFLFGFKSEKNRTGAVSI